jgi:hypothetical protein
LLSLMIEVVGHWLFFIQRLCIDYLAEEDGMRLCIHLVANSSFKVRDRMVQDYSCASYADPVINDHKLVIVSSALETEITMN